MFVYIKYMNQKMANKNKDDVFIFRLYFQFLSCLKLDLKGNNMNCIKNFIAEEDGVTAIEYALIAALVAAALVTAVGYFTTGLDGAFKAIGTKLTGAAI